MLSYGVTDFRKRLYWDSFVITRLNVPSINEQKQIAQTVIESRIIEVDDKTYRKLKKEQKKRPYSIKEMMFYDEIFDEWDD